MCFILYINSIQSLLNIYLVSLYYVLAFGLHALVVKLNKTGKDPALRQVIFSGWWGETGQEQIGSMYRCVCVCVCVCDVYIFVYFIMYIYIYFQNCKN